MIKNKMLMIRLDYYTLKHLERVCKEFGMDKANTIRVLINNEYRYYTEQDLWTKIDKEGK